MVSVQFVKCKKYRHLACGKTECTSRKAVPTPSFAKAIGPGLLRTYLAGQYPLVVLADLFNNAHGRRGSSLFLPIQAAQSGLLKAGRPEQVAGNRVSMIAAFLVNATVVAIVVLMHYTFLSLMTRLMPKMTILHHFRIVLGVIGALIAHSIEVWTFAVAYYLMHHDTNWGRLEGDFNGSLFDCVYFCFSTF